MTALPHSPPCRRKACTSGGPAARCRKPPSALHLPLQLPFSCPMQHCGTGGPGHGCNSTPAGCDASPAPTPGPPPSRMSPWRTRPRRASIRSRGPSGGAPSPAVHCIGANNFAQTTAAPGTRGIDVAGLLHVGSDASPALSAAPSANPLPPSVQRCRPPRQGHRGRHRRRWDSPAYFCGRRPATCITAPCIAPQPLPLPCCLGTQPSQRAPPLAKQQSPLHYQYAPPRSPRHPYSHR